MSRSYRNRKNNGIAIVRDGMKSSSSAKFWKKLSNKKMRKTIDLINGNMYKKNGYTWYIHDYRFIQRISKDWHKYLGDKNYHGLKYFMCK